MASPSEPARPPAPSRAAEVLHDRDRSAAELHTEVIQRIFSIGLHLESTAAITIDPKVRNQVEQAINDLDHVIRILRDAVFGPETRQEDRALRAGIAHLCEQLSPDPDGVNRWAEVSPHTAHPVLAAVILALVNAGLASRTTPAAARRTLDLDAAHRA